MFKILINTLILTVFTFGEAQLLKTGQTISYDTDGTVVTDGSVKDDGFYQIGKARSYSRSAAGVVTDQITGLEWQDNVDSAYKSWLTLENYTNGNYHDTSGDTATTYCSDLTLDGGEWRLPSIEELETLVDNGKYNPSVTENIFEHISSSRYWSSTADAYATSYAWIVHFGYGNSNGGYKTDDYYVRCVRGGQLETSNFSRDDATEIVTDSTTGLQWQDNEIVETATRKWQEAIDYCENDMALGGHNDWRLPNSKELLSIADRTRWDPAVDTTYFFNILSSAYWSSTTYAGYTSSAWFVTFSSGGSGGNVKADGLYVRCVRGGQFDTSASLPPVIMYLLD